MIDFKKTSSMINILTHGWLGRIFILSLWALAIFVLGYSDVDGVATKDGMLINAGSVLFFANIFYYLIIGARIPIQINSQMAVLMPNYFQGLRLSLMVLIFIGLAPALVLLSQVELLDWFALMSAYLLLSVLVVAMMFNAMFFIFFILLIFTPLNIVGLIPDDIPLIELMGYSFPILVVITYKLLGNLENLRGKTMYFSRFLAMSSFSLAKTVELQEITAPKSKNIFIKWLVNSNAAPMIDKLNSNQVLTHKELIEIACQSNTVIGRGTYIFWGVLIAFFSVIAINIDESYRAYFIPTMIIFPCMMIGTGTMTLFQNLFNKKSYLTRIATFPTFAEKNSFIKAFLSFVIIEQLKLYSFIFITVSAFAYIAKHLTWAIALNSLLLGLTLCFMNIALMLFGLARKVNRNSLTIWLMFGAFIGFMVWMLVVVAGDVTLIQSTAFIGCFSLSVILFVLSIYRSYQRIPHWLV